MSNFQFVQEGECEMIDKYNETISEKAFSDLRESVGMEEK